MAADIAAASKLAAVISFFISSDNILMTVSSLVIFVVNLKFLLI